MKDKIFGLQKNVFFLGLTSFFNDFSSEMILSILPAFFISVLQSGAESMGLVEGIADFSSNIIKIYSGRLSDKINKRKIFAILGYSLSVATRPFYILAGHVGNIVGLRVTDRVGKGLRDSPRDALIALSAPADEMGKSFGYHRAMDTLGAIIGPFVAFLILERFPNSFNKVFITSFIVGILAISSLLLVKEITNSIEKRKADAKIFNGFSKNFKMYLISIFIMSLGTMPVAILLFRTKDIGFAIASIPLFYMIYNLSYAIFSIPAGKVADKIGEKKVIFTGYLFLLLGYIFLGLSHSLIPLIIGFLFVGTFSALTDGMQRAVVSKIVEKEKQGGAYGYLNASVGFGALFAGIVGGFLWQNYGDSIALIISSIFVILGLIIFLFNRYEKMPVQAN